MSFISYSKYRGLMAIFLFLSGVALSNAQLTITTDGAYTIEDAIKRPTEIFRLHLNEQSLTEIPNIVGEFVNLREVSLRGNQLSSLPDS
ncbi:MAG: hypothetical protein AAGD88_08750, partial [Bacteroidota bacterium]